MDPGTVEFVRRALRLKSEPRRGWVRAKVAGPVESVADHSWGVALLALAAAQSRPDLDRARILELAIVHDLCEAATGDLIPGEYADRAEKLGMERMGLDLLVETAPLLLRQRLLDRYEELATDASPEARLVHDLDKLEMAFQAERYAATGTPPATVAPFFDSAAAAIHDDGLKNVVRKLDSSSTTRGSS